MGLLIRDFIPADKDHYLALSKEFYHSNAVDHSIPQAYSATTFDACIAKNPYTRGFMFVFDDEIAGYALISLTWSNEVGGICVLLEEAYIDSSFRGKGIGSAFFAFMQEEYKNIAKRFRLEVTAVNKDAISLYNRLGFTTMEYIQMIKDVD